MGSKNLAALSIFGLDFNCVNRDVFRWFYAFPRVFLKKNSIQILFLEEEIVGVFFFKKEKDLETSALHQALFQNKTALTMMLTVNFCLLISIVIFGTIRESFP